MPRTIRQTLAERLLKSPRAAAFLRDFSTATGLPLRFATPLGLELRVAGTLPEPAVCDWMRSDPVRGRLCARSVQEGLRSDGKPAAGVGSACGTLCPVGLKEAAVPLRMGGEVFGYLLVGQVAPHPLDRAALNRWRHALERAGAPVPAEELEAVARSTEVVGEERFAAALRLLETAAGQLAGQMEDQLTQSADPGLSPPIKRACAFIRAHCDQPLSLGRVAAEVGVSREHFCTTFHKSTGLRFTDYLSRVRVERAAEWLRGSERSVTEIALACGFQTISHFNRRFRAITGQTPTAFRLQREAAATGF